MQKFKILLKNEKLKLYNRFSWFFLVAFIMLYVYLAFFVKNNSIDSIKYMTLGFISLSIILDFFTKKEKHDSLQVFLLFILITGWAFLYQYLLAGVTFILLILFKYTFEKKFVTLSTDNIIYPSVPRKKIRWVDLNNVLLKDGLLTIDFKNNKIIQQIIDETKTSVDEKEFNDFCRQQLNQ